VGGSSCLCATALGAKKGGGQHDTIRLHSRYSLELIILDIIALEIELGITMNDAAPARSANWSGRSRGDTCSGAPRTRNESRSECWLMVPICHASPRCVHGGGILSRPQGCILYMSCPCVLQSSKVLTTYEATP